MTQSDRIREIEQFLYREARLLDNRQFDEWLELFTDDVRYWMPSRSTRYPLESRSIRVFDEDRATAEELFGDDDLALFDESIVSLRARIDRMRTGMAWAEDPPSRTTHLITNIEVEVGDNTDEVVAYSNFLAYRNRVERQETYFVGNREDRLKKQGDNWKIQNRKIVLTQNVLLTKNLSIFF